MQITNSVYLVGSEQFALSHLLDCNCYLLDHGQGIALIDTGLGLGVEDILANFRFHGFDPRNLSHIVITHAHLGHWGGAAKLREMTGAEIWAPAGGRYWLEHVDEDLTIAQNLKFGRWPKDFDPKPSTPDGVFGDVDRIQFDGTSQEAIVVQGHKKDSP